MLKGYLLIRGLHSREEVLAARKGFFCLLTGSWKTDIFLSFSCAWARGSKWARKAGRTHWVWSPWCSMWSWLRPIYGGKEQLDALVIQLSLSFSIFNLSSTKIFSPEVRAVLEGDRPKNFFRDLLQAEVKTFDFKWLRGVHRSNWRQTFSLYLLFQWLLYSERGSRGLTWTMCTWVVEHLNFSPCRNVDVSAHKMDNDQDK